jgi:hypothetical protein
MAVSLAVAALISKPTTSQQTGASAHTAEGVKSGPNSSSPPIRFREIGSRAGLTTIPNSTSERRYIVETMGGGGVGLFDCDNDGRLDIVVVNDSTIDQYLRSGDLMVTLYHQDGSEGDLHFTDVTPNSGLSARGWGMAVAIGDYDNDGLPDLYVTGYGHNVLYHNLGGCRFEDMTKKAGVAAEGFSTGAGWADYDRDGHLDLFVARYVHTDLQHLPPPDPRAVGYRSVILEMPDQMQGETDLLFRNRGDGTFEDISRKAGVNDPRKFHGMGVVWGDYDNDGWPDLFVTNDAGPNLLYHNQRDGTFEEMGILSGTALGPHGEVFGNMAADFGDFDRDGKLDLLTTRYSRQPASLYRNGGSDFTDVAAQAKIAQVTTAPVKWGAGFGDFDNDGWPDVLIANGNFSSLLDKLENQVKYREPLQLFRNLGDRTFADVSEGSGLNDGALQSRRGTAFGDLNDDGKLDVVVFNAAAPPSVFMNETPNSAHRILFRLIGSKSNCSAVGARVTVKTTMTQADEVRAGASYNSSNDVRLHFGLGVEPRIGKIEVSWPSGAKQEFQDVPADAIYEIREDHGIRTIASFAHAR